MAATLQSQVVALANSEIGIAQALVSLQPQIASALGLFTNLVAGGVLVALPTAPLSTAGALGTADGSPVAANPIDTRIVTALSRAISSNDLATLNTFLGALNTFLSGAVPAQQGEAPQLLAKLTGG